jgi:hypothetical protein
MSGCEAVREMLVDAARGLGMENSLREHLESCPDCRRRLANERLLNANLAAIASQALPPASVRNAVMAEFRRANRPVPIRRPYVKWVAMAAAAVILLAVFVATRHRPEKAVTSGVHVVEAPVQAREVPVPVAQQPAAALAAANVRKPAKRQRTAKAQPPPAPTPPEVATDFFEIPYAEPLRPEESFDVFRMQVPRANMAVFGLPVAGGRLDSRVTADVLVGEDGVMRAIRFIR